MEVGRIKRLFWQRPPGQLKRALESIFILQLHINSLNLNEHYIMRIMGIL